MAIASIKNVAIIGGTHGNELTGVYLVKKFQTFPKLIARPSLQTQTILANPQAIALNRRYVERDLNRCFAARDLVNPMLETYEDKRAKAIAAELSIARPTNFIIDIHSTTANMGLTLLLSSKHAFNLHLAAYLCHINPQVRVCFREPQDQQSPMLRSLSPLGFTLEVGPIVPGSLNTTYFQATEDLIMHILDYLESYNHGQHPETPEHLDIYFTLQDLDYPRLDNGDIAAMIHPIRQGTDYQAMKPQEPLFMDFTRNVIHYEGNSIVYPIFINEVAYYEKHIAMILTQKRSVSIQAIVSDNQYLE